MKNAIALAAIAGIASAAAAQSATLNIVASDTMVDSAGGAQITLSVYGSADFGTHISGGGFALSAAGGAGVVGGMSAATPAWGATGLNDRGDAGDGNYTGLVFGQFIFLPPFPPAAESSFVGGETLVATFTVDILDGAGGIVDWSVAVDQLAPFTIEIFDEADGSLTQVSDVSFGSARVNVVPAPSAMALLGLGGIVAGRRRR